MIDTIIQSTILPAPCAGVAHMATIFLHIAVIASVIVTALAVPRVKSLIVRRYLYVFLTLLVLLSSVFIVSQIVWFETMTPEEYGSGANTLWLVYDWMIASALLMFTGAIRIFALWKYARCSDAPDDCPRRIHWEPKP